MKDLKHYFSSPKENADQSVCFILKETSHPDGEEVSGMSSEDVSRNSSRDKSKKKKRKRKLTDEEILSVIDTPLSTPVEPVEKKKRKKSVDVLKSKNLVNGSPCCNGEMKLPETKLDENPIYEKKRKISLSSSRKSRESSSSKENSSSDIEEKECLTPETSKSLLNYFSKVDKLPEIPEKPRVMKVEVLVHADSSGSPPSGIGSSGKKSSTKKKKNKKKMPIDFDQITSEELPDLENLVEVASSNPVILDEASKKSNDVIVIVDNGSEESCKSKNNSTKDSQLAPKEKSINSKPLSSEGNTDHGASNVIMEDTGQADDVVFVKCELPKEKPKLKHDGTLASFFNLGNRGPPVPYEHKIAKQLFLTSRAPSSIKKSTTNSNCQGNIAPFPSKSHIQQKDRMNILWNLNPIKFNFLKIKSKVKCPPWSWILEKIPTEDKQKPKNDKSFDSKAAFKDLKKELNLFPIACWQKELKKMKKGSDNCLWTERYRPHCSSTFLANTRSISKLKAWLTELKESSNSDSAASSGDEFVKEEDEKKSERKTVALLTGPPGTGKTAAVYAVAEEIGYNVLEINASCNRSGKRILNEFSEAMKSHKVGLSKLNFSKVKKKPEDPKRNLILIEDADLLFDDDEGFVPTLMTLGAGTKRPIILVANNPHAKHFAKLSSLFHAQLEFVPPTQDRLGSWLRTVSAVEGFHLGPEESEKLALSLDLRKSLLQLQLAQSHPKANLCKDEEEVLAWQRTGNIDLMCKRGRKTARRLLSALAGIDLIRPSKACREVPPYWYHTPEDSTLTYECTTPPSERLDDIRASLLGLVSPSLPPSHVNQHFEVPKRLLDIEKDACNMAVLLNRRSNALDIWPTLRQISRTEAVRLASHTKRNNRYFNYLSSLGVKGPPDVMQSLSTAFS